jgi:hypothetical protein
MILHATHYHAATHEIGKRLLFYIGVDSAARGNSSTMEVSIVCVELGDFNRSAQQARRVSPPAFYIRGFRGVVRSGFSEFS